MLQLFARWTMLAACFCATIPSASLAQGYPPPREGTWTAANFRFHTGETLPEVRLAYRTVGDPKGEPAIVLHGTAGSSTGMLTPGFAGELFGPGQPLDATRYFIILPDAIGHGRSSKPSDGLKARFPRYNYDDMVAAQYRLVTEGLGIKRARLVIGNSMGGMHTWIWGTTYPDFMDALAPMASQPTPMASRNWMMRRLIIDTIKADPDYNGGNYTTQPRSMKMAAVFFAIATNGGTLAWAKQAPTRAAADKILDARLAGPFTADANDYLYSWEASGDYDPSPKLGSISARLLAINAADDERNPPETGLTEAAVKRIKDGRVHLIPAGPDTRGHGTTNNAQLYAKELRDLLESAPRRGS